MLSDTTSCYSSASHDLACHVHKFCRAAVTETARSTLQVCWSWIQVWPCSLLLLERQSHYPIHQEISKSAKTCLIVGYLLERVRPTPMGFYPSLIATLPKASCSRAELNDSVRDSPWGMHSYLLLLVRIEALCLGERTSRCREYGA